mgnify:CR=1 FL=1
MKELYSPRLFLAAAALSFGLAANAQAMPRGEQPGPGIGMPGHHAMMHDRAHQGHPSMSRRESAHTATAINAADSPQSRPRPAQSKPSASGVLPNAQW